MTTTTLRSVRFRGRIRPPDDGVYGDPRDESEAGDGDAPAPRIARNDVRLRIRGAEPINVAAFIEPPAFRAWSDAIRQEVSVASGRPAKPGDVEPLNTKLAAAVSKA